MKDTQITQLQKEIVDSLPEKPHGRLLLAPRVGKSKIIIDILKREKPASILWVTPSAELADKDIPEEFDKWGAKNIKKRMVTTTWKSLQNVEGHFEVIILDEEQFATELNTSNLINGILTYDYILSMTGTPTKHENKKLLYTKLELSVLYKLTLNEAVSIDLLSKYAIKVIEVDLGEKKDVEAGNKTKRFKTSERANYEWLHKQTKEAIFQKRKDMQFKILHRMRVIKNSKSKFEAAKHILSTLEGRKLIFAGSIKQAEALCSNTYHSKTNNLDLVKFQKGEINAISMVNSGGTGFTYKEIDHLIMVQADSDKNGLTSQKIARTLLKQKDYFATIWIFCLLGTQDEKWVESALQTFDGSKVEFIRFKNINSKNQNIVEKKLITEIGESMKKHGVKKIDFGSHTLNIE